MRNLGLSIYPSLSGEEQIREYLQTGKRWGFQHLFTCLRASGIQQPGGKEKFARLLAYAHSLGYTVSCDVNHFLMEEAFGHAMELREIRELGIDRIRFDYGYSAEQIAEWSNHREGLLFELNMSGSKFALPHLWELGGNLHAFVGCHNFYPLRNTGLSYEQFKERNRLYKSYGIATAAFLGPADSHLFCVWPEAEGVVTLEESRDWSLSGQLAALFSDPFLDQAIVGNCFINEEECRVLSLLLDDFPHLPWIPSPGLPLLGFPSSTRNPSREGWMGQRIGYAAHKVAEDWTWERIKSFCPQKLKLETFCSRVPAVDITRGNFLSPESIKKIRDSIIK